MVGSAIERCLISSGYNNLVGRSIEDLDLLNQQAVLDFFDHERPQYVIVAAAKVGGIIANNNYKAQFLYENLMIQNNLIHASYLYHVKKLLFLGSSCIYPKLCPQPIKEEYILTGPLEPTNDAYAIAKISGIKMCEFYGQQYGCNYIAAMPTNLYGPNDNFDLHTSHVLPALVRKFHLAKCLEENKMDAIRLDLKRRPIRGVDKSTSDDMLVSLLEQYGITKGKSTFNNESSENEVTLFLWGSGNVLREFLYVDDLAQALLFMMNTFDNPFIIPHKHKGDTICYLNIGSGEEILIKEIAELLKQVICFKGRIEWDKINPEGTPRKLLDTSRLFELGWNPEMRLKNGIVEYYHYYLSSLKK
jgi:GDP-L-fucose synthase